MQTLLFASFWTNESSYAEAVASATSAGFDGVEGPPPPSAAERDDLRHQLADANFHYLAEITTCIRAPGLYVPDPAATVDDHVTSFRRSLEFASELNPIAVTCLGGNDLWPVADSIEFLARAADAAADVGIPASFETHRARSLFHPRDTATILRELPHLELTCDFSHWCAVTERLVLDELPELLATCAARARHIHARVGYDQGPQVPDPRAPEYADALAAHERWWQTIQFHQSARQLAFSTVTPEFGPDGYLHLTPFTQEPVANLREINHWIGQRFRTKEPDSPPQNCISA